jgi:dienelactone hydrolase
MELAMRLFFPFLLGLLCAFPALAVDLDAPPPSEDHVAPAWLEGYVYLPGKDGLQEEKLKRKKVEDAFAKLTASGKKLPAVLYMHGCSGVGSSGRKDAAFMSSQGYAVFMPRSLARDRHASCDPKAKKGGLIPEIKAYRQQEIVYSLARLRELPFIDQSNLILMGHSEGCGAVLHNKLDDFRLFIASACNCKRTGIRVPKGKPLLIYRSENDPWSKVHDNNCTPIVNERPAGSRSLLIPGDAHWIGDNPEVRAAILEILARYGR